MKDGKPPTSLIQSLTERFLIHRTFTKYSLQRYSGLNYTALYISFVFVESELAV